MLSTSNTILAKIYKEIVTKIPQYMLVTQVFGGCLVVSE